MTDEFSPVPQHASRAPEGVSSFAPVPVVKSKGPKPSGAGAGGASVEGTDFDPTAMMEGNRSTGPGGAGRGSNRDSRPAEVDKGFNVLP